MRHASLPDAETLQEISLFRDLSPMQRSRLHAAMHFRLFRTGDFLMQQGRRSEAVFFVHAGSLKICRIARSPAHTSREMILRLAHAGAMIGEAHLRNANGHAANVVALEPVTCFMASIEVFERFVHEWPVLNAALMRLLSENEHRNAARLEIVALHNVVGVLAAQLLLLAEECGEKKDDGTLLLPLPLTQSVLAGLTGHSRESINKALKSFQANGWIESQSRHRLLLRDCEALRRAYFSALPRSG